MKPLFHTPVRADLHFHSTLSDGRKTPDEIVAIAKERGIQLLVNTDHDIVNTRTPELAREAGIKSFEGVEISAHEPVSDKHLHITCYAQKFSDRVHAVMEATRDGRWVKIRSQIEMLQRNGFNIELSGFIKYFEGLTGKNLNPANGHLAEYAYRLPENIARAQELTGKEIDYVDFIYECLKREGEFAWIWAPSVPNYEPSIELCGELARENNALLSIAHPNFSFGKDIDRLDTLVAPYVEAGVRGIEINSAASRMWVETILRVQKRYDLILTFGSDCHFKPSMDRKHNELGSRNPYLSDAQFGLMAERFIETVEG